MEPGWPVLDVSSGIASSFRMICIEAVPTAPVDPAETYFKLHSPSFHLGLLTQNEYIVSFVWLGLVNHCSGR